MKSKYARSNQQRVYNSIMDAIAIAGFMTNEQLSEVQSELRRMAPTAGDFETDGETMLAMADALANMKAD